ncbi:MAG: hypothetical protein A2V85_17155 [Chloroflexi bacterium RBG_16_72_14]|nr:MAG: hypothetical protein A2V85_17155 [Chloroflexi bacterium RBG_16_72_14]
MIDLAFRRVAGGREPDRVVLRLQDPEPAVVWRSRGAAVGRFSLAGEAVARVRAAAEKAGALAPPESPSTLSAHVLAEYLTLDEASLAVPAGTEVDGPWGDLLAACRAALDAPTEPVAAITLIGEPPARVRVEHRGSGQVSLGFGALNVAIRWAADGVETAYAGAQVRDGVVEAGPGWSTTIELDPPADPSPAGEPVATATLSIMDEGVWIPVALEVPVPT